MKNNKKLTIGGSIVILLLSIGIVGFLSSDLLKKDVNINDYIYSTFLGGTGNDQIRDVATDS
ncbi:MAG: hypothetical protein ACXAD7_16180, partial [Candidatus Kariarchaeaceae archaeon]